MMEKGKRTGGGGGDEEVEEESRITKDRVGLHKRWNQK
jgi:hypothetical protein